MAFEEPKFSVISKLEEIEIRQYSEYLVAETEVQGDRDEAGSAGFKILAGYIFGNNRGDNNIAMTAPVVQTERETLEMGSPLISQSSEKQKWTLQFMMPSKYSLDTLPKPKDPRVHFKQVPARKMASITYSGRWTESNYKEHLDVLIHEMSKAKLKGKGTPIWARYNSPFTPWFLRKNEILIEIE